MGDERLHKLHVGFGDSGAAPDIIYANMSKPSLHWVLGNGIMKK